MELLILLLAPNLDDIVPDTGFTNEIPKLTLVPEIFVAVFKQFDVLEIPKDKDIKQGEIKQYDKKSKSGKVYVAEKNKTYLFSGSINCDIGDFVDVFIDGKNSNAKIYKKNMNGKARTERVYVTYKAVKRCSSCGKMFYAKQKGNGTGKCDKCNRR